MANLVKWWKQFRQYKGKRHILYNSIEILNVLEQNSKRVEFNRKENIFWIKVKH